jgi:uncharacterized protein (TIGR02246 family)
MTDFVIAETGIRQLHARYVDAVWRKDFDAFGDCFAQDCEWRISGMVLRGRSEIVEIFTRLAAKYRRILVTLRTPILEVGNKTATGRTYLTEQNVLAEGRALSAIGLYYERFVEHDDRWRFQWRLFQTHYAGPPDMSGPFIENPDYGPPPAMAPADAIPVASSSGANVQNVAPPA